MDQHPSELWLLSYTGETTDGLLLGFEEMGLDMEVRLLVRDWTKERADEVVWNKAHPERPRDWAKATPIEATARSLPEKPWASSAGGKIRFMQRFYPNPPFAKVVLYVRAKQPFAGFLGFYRYDPRMELCHPSIYVDVGQPILRSEHSPLLHMLRGEFERRWQAALTIQAIQERNNSAAEQGHAADAQAVRRPSVTQVDGYADRRS